MPWRSSLEEVPSAGSPSGSSSGSSSDRAWEAEAERLRSERPPHWG